MKLFQAFLTIFGVGLLASLIPYLWVSLIMGFPAVLTAAILVTLIFRKELQ